MIKNPKLLQKAYDAWVAAADLRATRSRLKRYTYGDQWCDPVTDEDGAVRSERDMLLRAGRRPLTNNRLRQLVKTIIGRFRLRAAEVDDYSSETARLNRLLELDCRLLEEFVISGCAIQRVWPERRAAGQGVWIDNVNPDRFFVNHFTDPRGIDIDFIGMLHDYSPAELINQFGGNRHRVDRLRQLMAADGDSAFALSDAIGFTVAANSFFRAPQGRHRVIEIWRLRALEQTRGTRVSMDVHWHCTFMLADGTVLQEFTSPFQHESHPFVVNFYPLIDGEIHPFVEDLIDQQRSINRIVVMLDSMLATSAKGVLIFPTKQLPNGMTIKQIGSLWARSDAVIPINGVGDLPQQVVTNTANSGAADILNLQLKLFEDVSGVNDALLGRNISAATGSDLYQQVVQNAAITLSDLMETFASFTEARNSLAACSLKK